MAHKADEVPTRAASGRTSRTETASELIQEVRASDRSTPRALISTIMGDMILPHGGTIGLSSLVRMGTALGLDERLTRTTAVRLVYDGWFTTEKVGRQSFYTITGEPLERFMRYSPRIYDAYTEGWSGEWRLLITTGQKPGTRQQAKLKADLQWEGAGELAPGMFAYPFDDVETLHRVLSDHGVLGETLILSAPVRNVANPALVARLARTTWSLDTIAREYEDFVAAFSPILRAVTTSELAPETAFIIRTLLILRYRKVVLKDPQLPSEMLPMNWAGHAARSLCRNLYFRILDASESFLRDIGKTQFGAFGPASPSLMQRFGGPV
jgi:phenylacetic acid degradation operon negative regulatory protein